MASATPDLSRRIAGLAAIADRAATWSIVRGLLGVVAIEILVFSLDDLVLGDEAQTSTHSARHLGAFTVAYAVGLLVVVARPARARTMLPVAAVLAGALLVTAIVDLANGRVPLVDEVQHLPELLSVVLVWLVAVPGPKRRGRFPASRRSRRPTSGSSTASAAPCERGFGAPRTNRQLARVIRTVVHQRSSAPGVVTM